MLAKNTPQPPAHLRPETREWFRSVVADWALQSHHVRLLTLAAESWDRLPAGERDLGEGRHHHRRTRGGREASPGGRDRKRRQDQLCEIDRAIELGRRGTGCGEGSRLAGVGLMVKRTSTIAKKFKPSQAALDAWHAGNMWELHRACGLAPWEFSPLPESFDAYGLPEQAPAAPETCMDLSWGKGEAYTTGVVCPSR